MCQILYDSNDFKTILGQCGVDAGLAADRAGRLAAIRSAARIRPPRMSF